MQQLVVEVCMGSSCFSRGNNRAVELLQQYSRAENIPLILRGALCAGGCTNGPHISINGIRYDNVTPETVVDILKHARGAS